MRLKIDTNSCNLIEVGIYGQNRSYWNYQKGRLIIIAVYVKSEETLYVSQDTKSRKRHSLIKMFNKGHKIKWSYAHELVKMSEEIKEV